MTLVMCILAGLLVANGHYGTANMVGLAAVWCMLGDNK